MEEINDRVGSSLRKAADALHAFLGAPTPPTVPKSEKAKSKKQKKGGKPSAFEPFATSDKDESVTAPAVVTMDLFEKLSSVHLLISFNNPPSDRLLPVSCVVPHVPLRIASDESATAFLLVKYPQRKIKDLVASSSTLSTIIRKVSDEDKFRKKFSSYESRRTLCRSFPSLLVDERILPAYIPLMFGKDAIAHNRFPVSVCVHQGAERLENDLENALKTIQVLFRGQQTVNVCLGYTNNLTGTQIAENALAVLNTIVRSADLLQRGWIDIESIALEDSTSRARLLVYAHNYLEEVNWMHAHPSAAVVQPILKEKHQSKIRSDAGLQEESNESSLPAAKRMKQSTLPVPSSVPQLTTTDVIKGVVNTKRAVVPNSAKSKTPGTVTPKADPKKTSIQSKQNVGTARKSK